MKHNVTHFYYRDKAFVLIWFAMISIFLAGGCSWKKNEAGFKDYVVMAIEGDVDSFNPLFAEDVTAGEINDLFFPGLMDSRFDTSTGQLSYRPLLAKSWEYANDHKDIVFHLRADARWSDGERVIANDIQLSYLLYGDTSVASVRQTSTEGLRRSLTGQLDIRQAVEVVDDSTVCFHFDHPYPGQLFDAGLPILPSHVLQKIQTQLLREDSSGRHPVSSGPFVLTSWKPLEEIILSSNPASVLPHPGRFSRFIYKVVPDYHSRLMQLQSGEIDLLPYINADDAVEIQKHNSDIAIVPLGERFYDALNWNNIDGDEYARSKGKHVLPNTLFGTAKVRRALMLAVNRKEIIASYLHGFGRECVGPVSPLFRWAYNDTLTPLPFDPATAVKLLAEEGWEDHDGDGILDKNGKKFSFVLKIPSGNQLRATIATIVQNQLHALKIEMKIEQMERAAFWNDLMEKKFDACIAGFNVPLQMQLDELWGGDLERSRFNLTSFRNKRVDEILTGAKQVANDTEHAASWKEFQIILQREQPCTFLYWMNDLVAVNKRIEGTDIGALGITHHAEEWHDRQATQVAGR